MSGGALAAAIRRAALTPAEPTALTALGRAFARVRRPDLAAGAYARALALDPDRPGLRGRLLHQRLLCCDWRDLNALVAAIERAVDAGETAVDPFCWQAVSASPRSSRKVARAFEAHEPRAACAVLPARAPAADGRIRIGYVSGEFYDHATAVLMAGVWEHHDRARFAVIGFDNGADPDPDSDDPTCRRVDAAFDQLIPIRDLDAEAAGAAVRAAGIDVLIDLNGYFGARRPDLFRARAAPVQVNYLGFPGTVGDGWMDYLIADHVVVPDEDFPCYAEKLVRLPRSYQANDDRRAIASHTPSRAAHGLPEDGFVFACFNAAYKLLPAMLDRWAAILARVEGAVLWLIDDDPAATRNLRSEAAGRGIDPARLVFAPRLPLPEHLARHARADLFLDTLPYGAHTTASDALWAGLPVLTTPGATFPGRVAASLLAALDLPELIAPTPAAYAELAVTLARDPARLARLRAKLAANRRVAPLFDTAQFTRGLERAFAAMHARAEAGLAPDHFDVPAA